MAQMVSTLQFTVDKSSLTQIIEEQKIRKAMGEDLVLAGAVKDAAKAYGMAVYEARAHGLTVAINLKPGIENGPVEPETCFASTTVSRKL